MEELTPLQRDFLSGLGDQERVKEWLEDNHSERNVRTGRTHAILAKAIGDALFGAPGTIIKVEDHFRGGGKVQTEALVARCLYHMLIEHKLEDRLKVTYGHQGVFLTHKA